MLDSLRKASSGLVAKFLLGILAASFAVWGATDIFSGSSGNVLAKVGDVEITPSQYRRAFQQEVFFRSQQYGGNLTQARARELGFDRLVFSRLITEAALDNQLEDMGVSISPELIAKEIVNNPAFHDITGKFDRLRFDQYLRASGLSEQGFLNLERKIQMRDWLQTVFRNNSPVSKTMVDALATYEFQKRVANYFILPESAIGSVTAGDEAELKKIYNAQKARFTSPEYRKVSILALEPIDIQSSIEVDDGELKEHYHSAIKRYSVPEKRVVQQIPFADAESAKKAYEDIKSGAGFLKIANQEGFESPDVNLGDVTKSDIPDKTIANAAFTLKQGEVSEPVKGALSHIILRVTKITPGKTTPFEKVKKSIKQRIQLERSQEEVQNRHDAIEDARGEGLTFAEIAKKFGMDLKEIAGVDARGFAPDGKKAALPKNSKLLAGIYDSDVGLENDPISTTTEGYIWYEVLDVKKSRLKPFDEVKSEVEKLSLQVTKQKKLREKAATLIKKIDKDGASFAEVAASVGAKVQTSKPLKRNDAREIFSSATLGILFGTPLGEAAWAPGVSDIVLLKTAKIIEPKLKADGPEMNTLRTSAARALDGDLGQSYLNALQLKYPVSQNTELWQNVRKGIYARGR